MWYIINTGIYRRSICSKTWDLLLFGIRMDKPINQLYAVVVKNVLSSIEDNELNAVSELIRQKWLENYKSISGYELNLSDSENTMQREPQREDPPVVYILVC